MTNVGYPPVPLTSQNEADHRRLIAQKVNNLLGGQMNVTIDVTLTANSATTTLTDQRIGVGSAIIPAMALTSDAAADLAAGIYVTNIKTGQATINHRNNAATDRTIRFVIVG